MLLPLGARSAELDPAWRILSSYGGWRMTTADYARFYQAFEPGNPAIGPRARAWMMSPGGKRVGGGVHYGLGTFVRPTGNGGANFWHWGAWTYTLRGAYDGTLNASYSAFAVRLDGIDTNMVAHIAPRIGEGRGRASSTVPWAGPRKPSGTGPSPARAACRSCAYGYTCRWRRIGRGCRCRDR